MSADNRKVSTDALETLGKVISSAEKRDAIHLAVIPMQCKYPVLRPGDHLTAEGDYTGPYSADAVGIVDPFLRFDLVKGDWFWLVIYPRVITSLRHVWTHPAFPEEAAAPGTALAVSPIEGQFLDGKAKRLIEEFAARYDTTFDDLMAQAETVVNSKDQYARICFGRDITYQEHEEFWPLWTAYTGRPVPTEIAERSFRCAC